MLKAAFLVYAVPILLLLLSGLAAYWLLARLVSMEVAGVVAALASLSVVTLYGLWAWRRSGRGAPRSVLPRVVTVLR